jgi:hypothetical protein
MYQLISSPIVNAPPPSYILKLLQGNKPLYVPLNGHRSESHSHSRGSGTAAATDTKEDMIELFAADVDGRPREARRLMNRRNYVAIVAYDPETVNNHFGRPDLAGPATDGKQGGRLSLAVDFMVQAEGAGGAMAAAVGAGPGSAGSGGGTGGGGVVKFGPVVVPSLEFGK